MRSLTEAHPQTLAKEALPLWKPRPRREGKTVFGGTPSLSSSPLTAREGCGDGGLGGFGAGLEMKRRLLGIEAVFPFSVRVEREE